MDHREGRTLSLPLRTEKPRFYGTTSVTDLGTNYEELSGLLDNYQNFIDHAKLGIGSAYLEPNLKNKIALYYRYNIPVHFGGTLFEKYYHQNKLDDYLIFLNHYKINWIEISNGTIDIHHDELLELIIRLSKDFKVFAEVGKKAEEEDFSDEEWVEATSNFLEAGCAYTILEGRNTADGGIYTPDGNLRTDLIKKITSVVDHQKIIFEAPTHNSQSQLIATLGSNVNMGNIFLKDLLVVESQRVGLRSETFFIK
ncbi:MAG: phosphosulfolactate synthase [Desulfotalea sp.]